MPNSQGRPDKGDQEKGSNQGGNDRNSRPKPATTPELDAGVLYAIGIASAGTLLYMRQHRRGAARAD